VQDLQELGQLSEADLLEQRYAKFRRMGRILDPEATESGTTP
jgi:acetyl-CoA carboxylase alpha subunit